MQLTEIRINLCPVAHHPLDSRPVDGRATDARPAAAHRHPAGGPPPQVSRLRAFCSLTFDDTFVVRDVKLIEGNDGLFLAMPSRKLSDHCPTCREKNHLRARYCNQCGGRLDEHRHAGGHRPAQGDRGGHASGNGSHPGGAARPKLHADVAHPINARCRHEIERRAVEAYWREVERSKLPGYVPPSLDHEDFDLYDARPVPAHADRAPAADRRERPAYAGVIPAERMSAAAVWPSVGATH